MAEWIPDLLYQQISDELLFDPLPRAADPVDLADPTSRPDGSWCEDRDPVTDLTDLDGHE